METIIKNDNRDNVARQSIPLPRSRGILIRQFESMKHQLKSLLSTKKQGTFIKNKNCSKLDQKSSKIGFVTPKIVVYCNKLTKIILL